MQTRVAEVETDRRAHAAKQAGTSRDYGRDVRLFAAMLALSVLALAISVYGARVFTEKHLEREVERTAVYWAQSLRRNLPNLDRILATGTVTAEDQRLFDLARELGRLVRYKVFDRDGKIVAASRPNDIGQVNNKPYFRDQVQNGRTFVKFEKDTNTDSGVNRTKENPAGEAELPVRDPGPFSVAAELYSETTTPTAGLGVVRNDEILVGEAYVPIMGPAGFKGAVEVYVDATPMADSVGGMASSAQIGLAILLLVLCSGSGAFVFYNVRARNRDFEALNNAHAELHQAKAGLEENLRNLEIAKAESDRLQAELVSKERLAIVGELTATVNHELRNPLGAISSSIFIVKRKLAELDVGIGPALERAERGIDRCEAIISDLLEFTRSTTLDLAEIGIDQWLDATIEDVRPAGVTTESTLTAPRLVLGFDESRLRRAIINVINNAVQAMGARHTAPTEACIRIETRLSDERYEMVFRDNGAGIDEATLARIFDPLFSTKSFGVGLGMSTIKKIMEQHDGGVEVKSRSGVGTAVTLWLPLRSEHRSVA